MTAKRALIVDDSTTAQYRLKKMLRAYNLHIDVMDSGEAALRYLATNEPDVIFMDHLMPGMDGFRVLQIIKSHPETATIPVIMYTSKSGDVYTGQARALGALDVVSKDTINAADLSKVMQTIHLYPQRDISPPDLNPEEKNDQKEAEIIQLKSPKVEVVAPKAEAFIERRAPNRANSEQSRNLELRLSHLEHTLEDSRRFITSRVVKELQSLKQNLHQEFTDLHAQTPPAADQYPPVTTGSKVWSGLGVFTILFLLVVAIIYLDRLSDSVSENQKQQRALGEKISLVTGQQQQIADVMLVSQKATDDLPIQAVAGSSDPTQVVRRPVAVWDDLAWVFNQSSFAPFAQSSVDLKLLLRLHELVSRATNKGFKGTLSLTYSVGNFCVVNNAQGQAQLAPDNSSAALCMLSSELYGMENIEKRYSTEIEAALNNLNKQQKQAINIVIATIPGPESYPERSANMTARDWNQIALANNRFEIKFDTAH